MTSSGALLVALLFQSPIDTAGAASEAATTRARLEVRGAADCISRNEVVARVAARSPRIQFVGEAAISANVALTSARAGNVVAELALTAAGIEPAPRRIVARSCAEAADAIALMIAVTLDPTLKRKAAIGAAGADTAGGGSAAPDAGTTPAAPPPAKPEQPVKGPEPPVAVEPAAPPAPVAPEPARRHFGAYVAGETIFGPAPAVMPGIALHGMAALERGGVWAPALFVGLRHAWRSDLFQTGGDASFTLDAASVDACPLRFGGSRFAARPCASALVGRLVSTGSDTIDAGSAARPFAAAGAALTATLGTNVVELYARLGIGVTLLRDSYEFAGMTFHRAGLITTTASLGVGLHWP
jgi:hypothetical protein